MKHVVKTVLGLVLSGVLTGAVFAEGLSKETVEGPGHYFLNGKEVVVQNDKQLVPLREFAEALGYTVIWKSKTETIVFEKDQGQGVVRVKELSQGQLIDGHWYVPLLFFESTLGNVVVVMQDGSVVLESRRYVPQEASTLGEIVTVNQGKDGVQILVKGQRFGAQGYTEISLAVSKAVPITGAVDGELHEKDYVYVQYSPAVTKSMPPLGQAIQVEVLKDQDLMVGKIMEMYNDPNGSTRLRVIGTSDFLLGTSADTVVIGGDGELIDVSTLREGMIVKVYMAPQAGAYKITVQ